MSAGTPCLKLPNTRTEAEIRSAMDMRQRAADLCNQLGDAEFARRATASNMGIATIVQRHYMACADAILKLPMEATPISDLELAGAGGMK